MIDIDKYIKHSTTGKRLITPFRKPNSCDSDWVTEGWYELKKHGRKELIAKLLMLGCAVAKLNYEGDTATWEIQIETASHPNELLLCIHKDGRADFNVVAWEEWLRAKEVVATRE